MSDETLAAWLARPCKTVRSIQRGPSPHSSQNSARGTVLCIRLSAPRIHTSNTRAGRDAHDLFRRGLARKVDDRSVRQPDLGRGRRALVERIGQSIGLLGTDGE
jgi:hypothetical protein